MRGSGGLVGLQSVGVWVVRGFGVGEVWWAVVWTGGCGVVWGGIFCWGVLLSGVYN